MRRDQEYVGRRVMEMELPEKSIRGRPNRGFLDVVKEDIGKVGAREKDIENKMLWRNTICWATPDQRERPKEEEEVRNLIYLLYSIQKQTVLFIKKTI